MIKPHELKTDPNPFPDSLDGKKPFELRKNDRNFKVGDRITLRETLHSRHDMIGGAPLEYTGREIRGRITYMISNYGLQPGYVAFSYEEMATVD